MKRSRLQNRYFKQKLRFVLLIAILIFILNACSIQRAYLNEEANVEIISSVVHLQEFESKMMESVYQSMDFQKNLNKNDNSQ